VDLQSIFPYEVQSEDAGERIDVCLSKRFPHVSRSRWKGLIEKGVLTVRGRADLGASYPLKVGEWIEVDAKLVKENFEEIDPKIILRDLPKFKGPEPRVVKETLDYAVVDKPVGLAVHPGAGLQFSQTLVCWALGQKLFSSADNFEALLSWGEDVVEEFRPGIVHRLDQPTSGLMVLAKNPVAHRKLSEQFSAHTAQRLYYALVKGSLKDLEVKLSRRVSEFLLKRPCPIALKRSESQVLSFACFLRRDPVMRTKFQVSPTPVEGKKAISHFANIAGDGNPYSWLEAKLETGRTHQIRASLNFLGLPILGDTTYGELEGSRLFLHAHHLEFNDPSTSKRVSFSAPWPLKHLAELPIPYPEKSVFRS
jgi:23S rRNA pseudouridine1911/1915/1917 synthase